MLINIRIGAKILEDFLALAFVVHQVKALAIMAAFEGTLSTLKQRGEAVPVTVAAGLTDGLHACLAVLAEAFEELVL